MLTTGNRDLVAGYWERREMKNLCVPQSSPPHSNLNFRGLELRWETILGKKLRVSRSVCCWPYRIPKSQPLRTPGSKMNRIVQPQIFRVRRAQMSSSLSVLPDTHTGCARAFLQTLLAYPHTQIVYYLPLTASSLGCTPDRNCSPCSAV